MAPPSTPDKFPTSDMFDTLIQVDVGTGSDMRTFSIVEGVLRFYSGYFNTALNGRFVEARDHHVKLPTEDAKIFELFRMWIHTRRFYESTLAPSQLLPFDMIAGLWIFADAHDVPLLQNVASDMILEKIKDGRTFPSKQDLYYIYHNTVDSSPLRRLIGEAYKVLCGKQLMWDEVAGNDDEQGNGGLMILQQPMKYSNLQLSQWQCKFHVHEAGTSCTAL